MRLYARHIRSAKLCMRGARNWFAMRELDYGDFLENGIDAEFIRQLNDPISNRVLAAAEREAT